STGRRRVRLAQHRIHLLPPLGHARPGFGLGVQWIKRGRHEVRVELAIQRGIEGRVRRVGLRAHTLTPGRKLSLQAGDTTRFASGKVSAFADILGEVEQLRATVLVMFDQLPVAITDRAGRLAALIRVVREIPVEWAWLRLAATQ